MGLPRNASGLLEIHFYLLADLSFFRRLGVIGAGLMGSGIANVSIDKGIQTVWFFSNKLI